VQPAAETADPQAHLVHYVPDEVCVLVQAGPEQDAAALYERVRRRLNAALANELRQPAALRGDAGLHTDLRPGVLAERFGGGVEVLQPLERPGITPDARAGAETRPPWLALGDRAAPETAMWQLYYAVGADRVDFRPGQLPERRRRLESVRELVNLLNRHHADVAEPLAADAGWSLAGGTPNWLAVAAQMGCGCPAGLPVAEPRAGRWHFQFAPALEAALGAGDQSRVVVAVLDTCPDLEAIADHGNAYLAEVRHVVRRHTASSRGSRLALHADYFAAPPGPQRYWNSCLPWWHDDLAQLAELRSLPDELLRDDPSRRLIVNLSLGATVPVPPHRHWAQWLPHSHTPGTSPPRESPPARLLEASHASLWSTIHWLHEQGVLVVAAAGNDGQRPQLRLSDTPPPPRYPARYQDVFAVAAATASGAPASYSNRADVRPLGNGITCFGGEIVASQAPGLAAMTAGGTAADGRGTAVVGVYSAERLPDGQPNTTGWAQWAGTSFAAPIIAGLAARLLASDASLTPDQLMRRLLGFAKRSSGAGPISDDPDGPLDAPLLDAWQTYQPPDGAPRAGQAH
jgi:hypothetical protein